MVQRDNSPRRVEVQSVERVYEDFFKIDRAVVRYERFDGTMSPPPFALFSSEGIR